MYLTTAQRSKLVSLVYEQLSCRFFTVPWTKSIPSSMLSSRAILAGLSYHEPLSTIGTEM